MYQAPCILAFCIALAACSAPQDVDELLGPEPETRDYPRLLPLGQLPAPSPAPIEDGAEANAALEARADALRTRAATITP